MATVIVQLVPADGGTKVKATVANLELSSERIYNRAGNARKAAVRLIEKLNAASGTWIAAFKA